MSHLHRIPQTGAVLVGILILGAPFMSLAQENASPPPPAPTTQVDIGQAPPPGNHSLPALSAGLPEIVRMLDAKVDSEIITAYIQNSTMSYHPTAEEVIMLKERGASSDVLKALLEHRAVAPYVAPGTTPPSAAQVAPTYANGSQSAYDYSYPDYSYASYPYYPYYPYYYPYYSSYYPYYTSWWPFFSVGFFWPFFCDSHGHFHVHSDFHGHNHWSGHSGSWAGHSGSWAGHSGTWAGHSGTWAGHSGTWAGHSGTWAGQSGTWASHSGAWAPHSSAGFVAHGNTTGFHGSTAFVGHTGGFSGGHMASGFSGGHMAGGFSGGHMGGGGGFAMHGGGGGFGGHGGGGGHR